MTNIFATLIGPTLAAGGAAGALVRWYIVDRRKSIAEARLSEDTLGSEINLHDTSAADARLIYVQKQMDLERKFHDEQLRDRDAQIAWQRSELNHRDDIIAGLLRDVNRLETQLAQMAQDLHNVRAQLQGISTNPNMRAVRKDEDGP